MEILLPYGTTKLKLSTGRLTGAKILDTPPVQGLRDENATILKSLRSPINSMPLVDLIHENDKVVVIITDNSRACPDNRILPVLLKEIDRKVRRQNVTIVVALGLHAPLSQQELIEKIGEPIVSNYKVENHDIDQTVFLGNTSRGTPVEVYKTVAEADFRISTGLIEPHFFAGFSGGRKSIAPGVSSRRSIHANHSHTMLGHPCSRAGILDGNPIHEDMVEQAQIANLNFIVNVIINENEEITDVVAGDYVSAHEKGCEIVKNRATIMMDHKVGAAIITNGGAPLDSNLYQTVKGISTALSIVDDGGFIIIASACSGGIGSDSFYQLHTSEESPDKIINKIKNSENFHGVQWQNYILALAQLRHHVCLLSELEDECVKKMMIEPIHSISEGLAKVSRKLGEKYELAIVPKGPYVIPCIGSERRNSACA